MRRFFSASLRSRWLATSSRLASATFLASSFSTRNFACIAASSSAVGPCSTTTSLSTVFSTIFSTYSTCFSMRGGSASRAPAMPPPPMPMPPSGPGPSPPSFASSALSRRISSWNSRIIASFGSSSPPPPSTSTSSSGGGDANKNVRDMRRDDSVRTVEARLAYSRVLFESSKCERPGCTLAIIATRPSPVRDPFNISVSLESR
mmetsp:Transcript_34114/g.72608  ORF Transcript_34114/g.72608 Transcript_34114/m.72608 type:complete len:204 (-) Transcript_34114:1306-1917(-)